MNAFIARLQIRLAEYRDSPRKEKVEWFRTVVKLDPTNYKLEYRESELHLLKLVLPKTEHYNEIWQWMDSTQFLPQEIANG